MPIKHHNNKNIDYNDFKDFTDGPMVIESNKPPNKFSIIIYFVTLGLLLVSGIITLVFCSVLLYKQISDDANTAMIFGVVAAGVQIVISCLLLAFGILKTSPVTARTVKWLCWIFLMLVTMFSGILIYIVIDTRRRIQECVEDSCVKNKNAFDNLEYLFLVNTLVDIAGMVFVLTNTLGCTCYKTSKGLMWCKGDNSYYNPTYSSSGYAEGKAVEGCCLVMCTVICKLAGG